MGNAVPTVKAAAKLGLDHYGKDYKWEEGKGWR
jgi:hypothetical protein